MNHLLIDQIDALLPQTQCTRCGFPDCRSYAQAIAAGTTSINRCPPGGDKTIQWLAALTGLEPAPLDPECGVHSSPSVATIDEAWCIGCTICIQYCPVDAILGAPKRMHSVIEKECTGCELCVAPCPVDCIQMTPVASAGLDVEGWLAKRAAQGRTRYEHRRARLARLEDERRRRRRRRHLPPVSQRKAEIASARQRNLERKLHGGSQDTE